MSNLSSIFAILFVLCIEYARSAYKVDVQDAVVQNGNLVSLNLNFGTSVNSFSIEQIQIWESSQISLGGATLAKVNDSFYSLSGLSIPAGNYTLKLSNIPPPIGCSSISPTVSISPIIVGDGTPASCTEAALISAINQTNQNFGGFISFSCGSSLVSIKLTKSLLIQSKTNSPVTTTVMDGNGLIELDGQGKTRILTIQGPDWRYSNPIVTVQGIRFVNGNSPDVSNTKSTDKSGGAIYGSGADLTLINCDFYQNTGPTTGQDTAGGAVFVTGHTNVQISECVFWSNQASNGGGLGVLGPNLDIVASVFLENYASGTGGNPGNGGNGGGFSVDGEGNSVLVCGSQFGWNKAHQFGSGMFRVGYNVSDSVTFQKTNWIGNNQTTTTGFATLYIQGPMTFTFSDSSVSFNEAQGNTGLFLSTIRATLNDITFANNTARSGLGSALSFGNTNGTFNHLSIGYNYVGAFGTVNGDGTNIVLSNSVISNNSEGNKYVALSCNMNNALFIDGGGNYQWPATRTSGQIDENCTISIMKQDPKFNPIDASNLGCVGPMISFGNGSPVGGSGARCTSVPQYEPLTYWMTNHRPVDRSVWFQFTIKANSVSWGTTSHQSGDTTESHNAGNSQRVLISYHLLLVICVLFALI